MAEEKANPGSQSRGTTLVDIARRAGVTVTTVSRALKNRQDISAATRRRILAIAEEMGYVPNALASGLRTRRIPFIGAVIMDNANPFFAGVLRGIQDTAYAHGYQTLLCNTDFDATREAEAIGLLRQLQVAGILLYPVETNADKVQERLRNGPPVVFMGRIYENLEANWVVFDDPLGGYLATRHALDRGYPKVAYLAGPCGTSATERRYQGYCRALAEAGRPVDPSLVLWGGREMADGYTNLKRLLSSKQPPLAVFCLNDLVAIGALRAAQELGLRVPDDVGIIGYDDIEVASSLSIPLTTIASSHQALGHTAAQMLFDVLASPGTDRTEHRILEPRLVVRASC